MDAHASPPAADEHAHPSSGVYVKIGLVLFILTLIINVLSRLLIWSVTREAKVKEKKPVLPAVSESAA